MQKNIVLGALLLASASFIQPSTTEQSSGAAGSGATASKAFTVSNANGCSSFPNTPKNQIAQPDPEDSFHMPTSNQTSPDFFQSQSIFGRSPVIAILPPLRNNHALMDTTTQCNLQQEEQNFSDATTQYDFQQEEQNLADQQNLFEAQFDDLKLEQAAQRKKIRNECSDDLWATLRTCKRNRVMTKTAENQRIKLERFVDNEEYRRNCIDYHERQAAIDWAIVIMHNSLNMHGRQQP